MGIQEIIVIILIIAAVSYTLYGLVKVFGKKADNSCGCSSCDLKNNTKDLKALIDKRIH